MAATGTHVALLRGINVGGRNRLPMRQLVEIFEAVGAREVRTYIQSGNVVFRAFEVFARGIGAARYQSFVSTSRMRCSRA